MLTDFRRLACCCVLWFVTGSPAVAAVAVGRTPPRGPAGDSIAKESAFRAQALLGPAVWSEVLRLDQAHRRSRYPAITYALVFELEGLLWFYTEADGTQSLSQRWGRAAADRADLGPLLRAIDPGFRTWTTLGRPAAAPLAPAGAVDARPLPNGCFIESVAALRRLIALGVAVAQPRLLCYYVATPTGPLGHTVLMFRDRQGEETVDATRSAVPRPVPTRVGDDPLAMASFLLGRPASGARVLPLGAFAAAGSGPPASDRASPPAASSRSSPGSSVHPSLM
jgi:hypothetical protein